MSTKQTQNEAQEVDVSKLTAEDVAQLATRLEEDEYANAFESLRDWHILRTLAFSNPDLIEPYRHLLDIEAFDEC
jgi:Protein of unknown function (DUF2555)